MIDHAWLNQESSILFYFKGVGEGDPIPEWGWGVDTEACRLGPGGSMHAHEAIICQQVMYDGTPGTPENRVIPAVIAGREGAITEKDAGAQLNISCSRGRLHVCSVEPLVALGNSRTVHLHGIAVQRMPRQQLGMLGPAKKLMRSSCAA